MGNSAAISILQMGFLVVGSLFISLLATGWLVTRFNKQNILAIPNHRSSHKTPVPIGGGWVIIAMTAIAWSIFRWPFSDATDVVILAGVIALAVLSWRDDKDMMPIHIRLFVQIIAIAGTLYFVPEQNVIFADYLPVWADRLVTAICWLWFINLFNFMDGIDGICGVEILQICLGLGIIAAVTGFPAGNLPVLSVIAGATAGFLWWNWHPARIFMGDIGAVTLGFFLGWQLIQLAYSGYLAAALIIPLYYLGDATFTLLWRITKTRKFWHPHKQHSYQRAAEAAASHSVIVIRIVGVNIVLLLLAIWSVWQPVMAIGIATLITMVALFGLSKGLKKAE